MNAPRGRGIVVGLLLAAGCGGSGAAIYPSGGGGSTGAVGDASGGAGGEPASAGASGGGAGSSGNAGSAGSEAAGAGGGGTGGWGTSLGGTGGLGGGGGVGGNGGGVGGTAWLTPPPVPPALAAPAGASVKLHAHAVGAQIYTCTASGGGADAGAVTYAWVLKAPDAKLTDSTGAQIGTHGAGPSWTANDGSVAHGAKVAELPSPLPDAISWLLLRVSSTDGPGAFSDVTYVQRLSTNGGKAPATGCDSTTAGTDVRASYSADYYFFTGGGAAAWLTAPTNVPSAIALPMGLKLKLHDHAIGVQIYNCAASGGADAGAVTYAWAFKAPDALLYDMSFVPVGSHGAGPSWTSSDGSMLVAKELARADAPRPDAIPWLLLKEFSTSGAGDLDDIAIVQRLNTTGGQAPATGCDATTVNTETRVPYSADYYFFVSVDVGDAGTGG